MSATPTFDGGRANASKITLKGNVTSSKLTNVTAGEQLNFIVCQDAVGGRSFAWPANLKGGADLEKKGWRMLNAVVCL